MKNVATRVSHCKMQQFLSRSWNFAWLLVGYSLVTCSLRVFCSFMLCCSYSVQLFMAHPIEEDTDLGKNAGVLFERCYLLLDL